MLVEVKKEAKVVGVIVIEIVVEAEVIRSVHCGCHNHAIDTCWDLHV